MSPTRRAMHVGVFVLGTGNHSAGWRYEGGATSNDDLSVIQEIARQAERGTFDRLFVSGATLRDHFGLPRVPTPAERDRAAGEQE